MNRFCDFPKVFDRLAVILTSSLLVGLMSYAWLSPEGFSRQLQKDGAQEQSGIIEHLTVLVLIPGILAGLIALLRYSGRPTPRFVILWILSWSLACIYFAGEEASWGQWYFNWKTPDFMAGINDQGETNLHNMSSWLDQKPRTLVEFFIFIVGFTIPAYRILSRRQPREEDESPVTWKDWIFAPPSLMPAGFLFLFIRVANWLPYPFFENLGNSELREFAIAWFLTWYLSSYYVRLKTLSEMSKTDYRLKVFSNTYTRSRV